jgi:hypothetical protein
MTSYQKLKAENARLSQEIQTLIEGEVIDKMLIESKWKARFNLERALMSGDSNGEIVGRVDGLLCMIKPHKQWKKQK